MLERNVNEYPVFAKGKYRVTTGSWQTVFDIQGEEIIFITVEAARVTEDKNLHEDSPYRAAVQSSLQHLIGKSPLWFSRWLRGLFDNVEVELIP